MNASIWKRLVDGGSLDSLGLGVRNGRLDLRCLSAPEPTLGETTHTVIADIAKLEGQIRFEGVNLQSLDFSGSQLGHLRFCNCVIRNCIFDNCSCREWKLWGTTVDNSFFRETDLRGAVLGGVIAGRRNSFHKVDFTGADLRGTTYTAAEFAGCMFKDTRLDKVDFQTSTFRDCVFEGELRDVIFYRRGFGGEEFPANEMVSVDFTHAQLRFVEFRNLDLDKVSFPEDADHLVLNNYPQCLDRAIQVLQGRSDLIARKLTAYLGVVRKWAGEHQRRGVLNKKDIVEIVGEAALADLLECIRL